MVDLFAFDKVPNYTSSRRFKMFDVIIDAHRFQWPPIPDPGVCVKHGKGQWEF